MLKVLGVFSAHAEVVPWVITFEVVLICILRARGGSSGRLQHTVVFYTYSPRMQRAPLSVGHVQL